MDQVERADSRASEQLVETILRSLDKSATFLREQQAAFEARAPLDTGSMQSELRSLIEQMRADRLLHGAGLDRAFIDRAIQQAELLEQLEARPAAPTAEALQRTLQDLMQAQADAARAILQNLR